MRRFVLFFLLFFSYPWISGAQIITQTVKGRIVDDISKAPLVGIAVMITFPEQPSLPYMGCETDVDGYYVLRNVPVGRINILFTCIGFEPISLQNISLNAGKELVMNMSMAEDIKLLSSAVVTAERDKLKPMNDMASTISGRTFSVDEAERFSGSFNDISRMAQNFAGVSTPSDASNDIVIRGNSPFGLLWRLEGVDIFNPNHFSDGGATGGPISMINVNALANSDFYTSVFPAEYVNGYSGVFDVKLREGNYDKREYTGQIGINGIEVGVEGPFSKQSRASYLANYRYSFLDVLTAMGFGFGIGSAVPRYQDWTVKLTLPTQKFGKFSLFSIGGYSKISLEDGESEIYKFADDIRNKGHMGVVGFNHELSLNHKFFKSYLFSLAASTSLFSAEIDTLTPATKIKELSQEARIERGFLKAQMVLNAKMSPKFSIRSGINGSLLRYKFLSVDHSVCVYPKNVKENGYTFLTQAYVEGTYRPATWLTVNAGINGQFFALNQSFSFDPRISLSYKINPKHEVNIGYGLHSQTQGLEIYLTKQWSQAVVGPHYPNKKLKMTKAHHFVVGYQWKISSSTRLKVETYYQYLYNLPVDYHRPYYCLVNLDGLDFNKYGQVYVSDGLGENLGIEFTFERFLSHGWYYLTTFSLFDSKYMSTDDIANVRNTRYNGNYVLNLVGGKEFQLSKLKSSDRNRWVLGADGKFVLAGGQRYIPVDISSSNEEHKIVYRYDLAYEPQLPYYMRADLKVWVKINQQKTTHEFGIEARNLTNRKNVHQYRYDFNVKTMVTTYQTGLLPLAYYRLTF